MYPEDLKYTKTHEWVKAEEGNNIITIGLSDYAVKQLNDIVFLELPEQDAVLKKGTPFGAVESVKAVFDLNSPVTGKVTQVNSDLVDDLKLLEDDPYKQGWMMRVKVDNPDELKTLMNSSDYENFVEQEKEQGH